MSRTSAQPSSQGLRGGERMSSGVPSLALPIARLVEHDSIWSQFRKRRRSRPCACEACGVVKYPTSDDETVQCRAGSRPEYKTHRELCTCHTFCLIHMVKG